QLDKPNSAPEYDILKLAENLDRIEECERERKEAEDKDWYLSDIFRGAKGSEALLQIQVKLRKLNDVYTKSKKSLVSKNDMIEPTKLISCDDGLCHLLKGEIFLSKSGSADIDCRWAMETPHGKPVAVYLQFKHSSLETESNTFNHDKLRE
ncbi:hypothetical protein BGZ49_004162, partial [Haplosporangium sp. Z 27]